MDFGDEIAEHGLRHLKVGYDAVFHGANGLDVARRAAQHALGLGPYGENLIVAPRVFFYGHHGRFAEHNAVALDVNASIGGPQVDGKIVGENSKNKINKFGHEIISLPWC